MLTVSTMKILAEKELKAEKYVEELKFDRDLAMYRDRLKEIKPTLIHHIETCIYNGIKNNSKIKLYKYSFEDMFKPINKYGNNILYYLADPSNEPNDAYSTAIKELADEVREELFKAGVKKIIKNSNSCFLGEPYLFLEV